MKAIFLSAAALVAVAVAPAIAQTAAPAGNKAADRAQVIQKVQEHFGALDADRDGFVTKAEAEARRSAVRQRGGGQAMQHHPDAMFDRIDANKDGSITRAEFQAVHAKMFANRGNGDRRAAGGGHGRLSGRMFDAADANNDGRVSLQEATAAAAAHFDRADANRDGTLTRDERRNARQAMRSSTER